MAGERSRGVTPRDSEQTSFDTNVAHVARVYNYWLGGKDNFAADRAAAEKVTFRARPAVARFFNGLELVEPGMVQASKWRPASEAEAASPAALWAGVARKP